MPPTMKRLYPKLPKELKHWAREDHFIGYVTKVTDGDTIHCMVQLGFGIELPDLRIRLIGIDAPELIGPEKFQGQSSASELTKLIDKEWIGIQTYHDQAGKYGRELAIIWHQLDTKLINVNQWMIERNMAKPMQVKRHYSLRIQDTPRSLEICQSCNAFILPTLGTTQNTKPPTATKPR